MKQTFFYYLMLTIATCGCQSNLDKSRISNATKLNSPYGQFCLYRYKIVNNMALGASSMTVVSIADKDEKFDYTSSDYLILDSPTPFFINWKSRDTLIVKCIGSGDQTDKQPIRKEIKKWKSWTFEVEYYSMLAAMSENQYWFNTFSIDPESITFKSKKDTLTFKINEVEISLNTNHIYIKHFHTSTINKQTGLIFSNYDIVMKNGYRQSDLTKMQAFVITKP